MELRWRIELFGGLRATVDTMDRAPERVLNRFRTQKTGLLLAYLAYSRVPSSREVLLELLWPEREPHAGRNSLSKELSWLRDQLEPPSVPPGTVLIADRASVQLNPAVVTTDVGEFQQTLQAAALADRHSERIRLLVHAVDLYRGPLLRGYYESWVVGEQERMAELYFQALGQLLRLLEAGQARLGGEADSAGGRAPGGDLHRALQYARQGVDADPLREEAQRDLMRLLAAVGQPAAALRQYRELERLLQTELGAAPEAATRALAHDIERLSPLRPLPDPPHAAPLEIAHVLSIGLLDDLRLPLEPRTALLEQLQHAVGSTAEYRRAEACGEVLRLPNRRGVALVFFRDPSAPVRCALELARAVGSSPTLRLRMGVHSGPVYRLQVNAAGSQLAGTGIRTAQWVMECGDAGHILLSRAAGELLGQIEDCDVCLQDLGECEVRRNVRLHLLSLYTGDLGSPARPERLRSDQVETGVSSVGSPPRAGRRPGGAPAHSPASTESRVVLLYRRHAQPDEQVLQLLEARLAAHGHRIFADRHLSMGVAWATEIERQVRSADAVIPLLSAASVQSELLTYEIQMADEAAQQKPGRPRLLPVRIRYTDPLPGPLSEILEPLEQTLWEGPQDNERLLDHLIHALQDPGTPGPVIPRSRLEPAGSGVPLDSLFYMVRSADAELHAALEQREGVVLIKGARQMGKTSLLTRGLRGAGEAGAKVVLTDLQRLNAAHLQSAETLLLALAQWIGVQLDLDVLPHECWRAGSDPSMNFERYLRREALAKMEAPVVWGLDGVDRLFPCDFGAEVLGLFRAWYNARSCDPAGPWSRLTLAMTYATEAHLFVHDLNQSPFNVGTRLSLEDFTFEQVADLNRRHGFPLHDNRELARFYRLVGGHPYLVRRGLHEMATRGIGIAALETQMEGDTGIFDDHLQRLLAALGRDPELTEVVRDLLQGRPCPTAESFYRLRSAGVMIGESPRDVRPRCQLYASYLERHLL
jgi:DNA-binding SARP family transcriptional activator